MKLDPATLPAHLRAINQHLFGAQIGTAQPLAPAPARPAQACADTIQLRDSPEPLNKTETAFHRILVARAYPWLGVQNITLKLARDCRYTPDFAAIGPNGEILFFEVKGFMRDDALVKLKVAARLFHWAQFVLVRNVKGAFTETYLEH